MKAFLLLFIFILPVSANAKNFHIVCTEINFTEFSQDRNFKPKTYKESPEQVIKIEYKMVNGKLSQNIDNEWTVLNILSKSTESIYASRILEIKSVDFTAIHFAQKGIFVTVQQSLNYAGTPWSTNLNLSCQTKK